MIEPSLVRPLLDWLSSAQEIFAHAANLFSVIDPQSLQVESEHISNVLSADMQELPDMMKHFEENHPLLKKAHAHVEHFWQKKKAQAVFATLVAISLVVPTKHKAVFVANRYPFDSFTLGEVRARRPLVPVMEITPKAAPSYT